MQPEQPRSTSDPSGSDPLGPSQQFWRAVRDISPLAAGVAVYGLAFGVLATQAQIDRLEVGFMGALVFAGSSQIIATERLLAGAGAAAAIIAGLALNLRLLLVAASVRDIFAKRPLWQQLLGAHLITDENWALMLATRARGERVGYWYLLGGGATLIFTWVLTTVAGAAFATAIPSPRALGIDFAFTAAFIALARSLFRGRPDLLPWTVSLVTVGVCIASGMLDASWAIVLGGMTGAATAAASGHD